MSSSKPNVAINSQSKKIKSKGGIKISKLKSEDKIFINKEKISRPSLRSKKLKDKSPWNQDATNFQTLEQVKMHDIISKNSPFTEITNTQTEQQKNKEGIEFNSKMLSQNSDFLSFVEKHEKLQEMNKNRRIKNKDNSLASTNTGVTTNINFTSQGITKIVRPFSGNENKQISLKNGFEAEKKIIVRPKTAQIQNNSKHSNDNKMSIVTPSNIENDKQDDFSNRLPLIEEKSSQKSFSEYRISSQHSDEKQLNEKQLYDSPKISEIDENKKINNESLSASK